MCVTKLAHSNDVSLWNDGQRHCKCEVEVGGAIIIVEVGGAIIMESKGLASPAPTCFVGLKIKISISVVVAAGEHMQTDQLLMGSHFRQLLNYITASNLLVQTTRMQ